jgi:hypothetical protein
MTADVFEAFRRMAEIIKRENQAIESGEFDLVGDLLDEKSSLANALETDEPRIVAGLAGGSGAKAQGRLAGPCSAIARTSFAKRSAYCPYREIPARRLYGA